MSDYPNDVAAETLGALYRNHHGEMEGLARRLLDAERIPESVLSAEDVVQAAFTKALRTAEQIREPRAYLFTVIRNDVRAASQQNRRRAVLATTPAQQTRPTDVHVADFSDLVANRMAVHKALYDLPPQQRTAVWATKALEYTQAETAEAMQKKPGTVARHVVRAVAALRAHLVALAVVGIMVLSVAGSRLLRTTQPAGSPPDVLLPHLPSASTWLYVATGCLLVFALGTLAFRAWTHRRIAIQEGGAFAPRPLMERFRESFTLPFTRPVRRRPPPRTHLSEEELEDEEVPDGYTRTRLPRHGF